MIKSLYPKLEHFFETKFLILPSLTILYWALFNLSLQNQENTIYGLVFGILLALMSFVAFGFTLNRSFEWEFFKSYVGKSLFFISLAMLMWGTGESLYLYSTVYETMEGIYDYAFILIDPFLFIGIFFLAKSLNTIKNLFSNISLFIVPLIILILNIFLISQIRNEELIGALTNFDINLVFILGSIMLSTFVISIIFLSGKKLGGKFKLALNMILIGILFQYIGDNLFEVSEVFQENGSLADLIFFLSILFIFYGVTKLNPRSLSK